MKYIIKEIIVEPHYVPLSAHIIRSYTVNVHENITTVNVESYFGGEALSQEDVQPLAQNSVVIVGDPVGDTLDWAYQQLIKEGDTYEFEYNFQGSFQMADRNLFVGGSFQHTKDSL